MRESVLLIPMLPILALSFPLCAQAPAAKGQNEPPKASVAAVPFTADQGINPEELIAVHATPYRPAMLRDPFSAPSDADQSNKGELVDDIAVKGRVMSHGKAKVIVSDSHGNVKTMGPGYRFRDGELVSVEEHSATFHQWDIGSTNTRVFRTVVKTFKREEGKR